MTKSIEVIQNIVHDFNHYVDSFDINFIDENFIKLNIIEKVNRLMSVTNNLILSKDFSVYFTNYLIDLKYNEHLKMFYKKENLTSKEIVDKITNKVIEKDLDYHSFNEEIKSIQYDPKLSIWDTVWLTDIPERVIINLLSDKNYSLYRIIGMANINNYSKIKYFKQVIDVFKYLRNRNDYESIAYLLTRNFGRNISYWQYANVDNRNNFNIRIHTSFKECVDTIKHESIHSKYKHVERYSIVNLVYNLGVSKNSNRVFQYDYTRAIENNVDKKLKNSNFNIMNYILRNRRSNNKLCKQIISMLEQKGFKEMKSK